MAIASASATPVFPGLRGTIGTSFTFVQAQTFSTPQNILAFPVLQRNTESADRTSTVAFVSKFVDGGITQTGSFIGVAGPKVTFIEWALTCDHSFNNPVRLILFFG
jgi:hypothetical protein